jgi:cupin fold WbuC family metalloprotein
MQLHEISPEVLVADEPLVLLSAVDLRELERRALNSPRRRARICAHSGVDAPLHEMIIALASGCYIRPHRHVAKGESYHMLEGRMDIVMFDGAGAAVQVVRLGAPDSGAPFFYRHDAAGFHSVLVRSGVAIFHETTSGPFKASDTTFAEWAPDEADERRVAEFLIKFGDDQR